MKTIPCKPLQSILEWEGRLQAGCFPPQIGVIKHLLRHFRALSCKLFLRDLNDMYVRHIVAYLTGMRLMPRAGMPERTG